MTDKNILPHIPEEEQTPTVRLLLAFIEKQQETIQKQQTEIDALKAEVARLKKLPKKPKIKPSKLSKDKNKGSGNSGKSNKSNKRKKKLTIHSTEIIKPDNLPEGSRLLGYENYTVQDMVIKPHNTLYRVARYQTPDGKTLTGVLPKELRGSHFGTQLKGYIIYQYYHQRVTQPLILQQLSEWGIDISSGQISNILIRDKEHFHEEKDELLSAGIKNSSYIHVDDTGSRHDGKNGYCTHIGNESFAWFSSTESKSRINFLELLRGTALDYTINATALDYMHLQKLPLQPLEAIKQDENTIFANKKEWNVYLQQLNITTMRHVRIATEGALLGTLSSSGFPPDLVIISDDAGQFNVLLHALCWVHADRVFQRIIPMNDKHAEKLDWVHTQIWEIFSNLKQYKQTQTSALKAEITAQFDKLCDRQTSFATLNQALKRLARNKNELLLVLERPDIPLQNNLSERDIREYVIKRKISGSTRSEEGRRCRDTFASLKKTCKKQGLSFWKFLCDRLRRRHDIPYLPDLLQG
ncbi:MAG TPA: transposase [Deltaproteobacteria bacterium]|nr:transposase [Deltaproteobacteria bacterium]